MGWGCWAASSAALASDREAGRARRVDYTYHRGDGRPIELGVSAAPLPLGAGQRGFIFTFQDVTDIKGLERTAQMRQRLAAVGEMAAGIAHEIRNPLASMSGAMASVVKSPAMQQRLRELNLEPLGSSADEFATALTNDMTSWIRLANELGIREN